MAANFYFVFVKTTEAIDLSKIGFGGLRPLEEVDLMDTYEPTSLFVGHHNGYSILSHQSLSGAFFDDTASKVERTFTAAFPDTDIAAFMLNESVWTFGYALIEKGKRQRVLLGSDGEIYVDIGEQLLEEIAALNKVMEEDGLEYMPRNLDAIAPIDFEYSYRVTSELISNRLGLDFYGFGNQVKMIRYA